MAQWCHVHPIFSPWSILAMCSLNMMCRIMHVNWLDSSSYKSDYFGQPKRKAQHAYIQKCIWTIHNERSLTRSSTKRYKVRGITREEAMSVAEMAITCCYHHDAEIRAVRHGHDHACLLDAALSIDAAQSCIVHPSHATHGNSRTTGMLNQWPTCSTAQCNVGEGKTWQGTQIRSNIQVQHQRRWSWTWAATKMSNEGHSRTTLEIQVNKEKLTRDDSRCTRTSRLHLHPSMSLG